MKTHFIKKPLKNKVIKPFKKKVKRAKKKKVIVFGAKNNFYKVVWGQSRVLMENEELASKFIKKSIWNNYAFFSKKIISVRPKVAIYKSRKLARNATVEESRILVNNLINRVQKLDQKNKLAYKVWYETLDVHAFKEFWQLLDTKAIQHINDILASTKLPVTGAHGDLHHKNILVSDTMHKYLIDWEYFRINGSLITDILRFNSWLVRKKYSKINPLYSPKILMNYKPHSFLNYRFNNDIYKLSLLTAISNTCMPGASKSVNTRTKLFLRHLHENI